MQLDIDGALVVANTIKGQNFADPNWAIQNPLWFMALRDEDIAEIHTQIWGKRRKKSFIAYAEMLSDIETTLSRMAVDKNTMPDTHYFGMELKTISKLFDSKTPPNSYKPLEKFYRYTLAVLFTPGLRTYDSGNYGKNVWSQAYFSGERFEELFNNSISTENIHKYLAPSTPLEIREGSITSRYSRIACLDTPAVRDYITDKMVASCKASNPMKFVYGIGWTENDRRSKHHYGGY